MPPSQEGIRIPAGLVDTANSEITAMKTPENTKTHKPRLTDGERYKRFLDAAEAVGASDDPKDFERAFRQVVGPKSPSIDRPIERPAAAKEGKTD
jgi:hypothetical protein